MFLQIKVWVIIIFLFHENSIEALYAKIFITKEISEEEEHKLLKFKDYKVKLKNEKYFIIKLPWNTTLFGETFNSKTFNFPALINVKCNITSKLHSKLMNYLYQPLTYITLTSKNQLPYNFSSLLKHLIELDEDGAICRVSYFSKFMVFRVNYFFNFP